MSNVLDDQGERLRAIKDGLHLFFDFNKNGFWEKTHLLISFNTFYHIHFNFFYNIELT